MGVIGRREAMLRALVRIRNGRPVKRPRHHGAGAPAFGHLAAECETGFCVGDEGGEASVACVVLSDVAVEVVTWFGSAWRGCLSVDANGSCALAR